MFGKLPFYGKENTFGVSKTISGLASAHFICTYAIRADDIENKFAVKFVHLWLANFVNSLVMYFYKKILRKSMNYENTNVFVNNDFLFLK